MTPKVAAEEVCFADLSVGPKSFTILFLERTCSTQPSKAAEAPEAVAEVFQKRTLLKCDLPGFVTKSFKH